MNAHPSKKDLDLSIAGLLEPDSPVAAHVRSCERCLSYQRVARSEHRSFLERFPTEHSFLVRQRAVARPSHAAHPWSWHPLVIGLSVSMVLAVTSAILVWRLPGTAPLPTVVPSERIKGPSFFELAVIRGNRALALQGQGLRPGDVLVYRYTTNRKYLLLLTLEEEGRIQALYASAVKKSMSIQRGYKVQHSKGIMLDEYPGAERLIALFSDSPLDAGHACQLIHAQWAKLSPEARRTLEIGRLPLEAEQFSRLIRKERP